MGPSLTASLLSEQSAAYILFSHVKSYFINEYTILAAKHQCILYVMLNYCIIK